RAPRRLRDVRLEPVALDGREDRPPARRDRGARGGGARGGAALRALVPPGRALVVLRPGTPVRFGRERPAVRRPLWAGPAGEGLDPRPGVPRGVARPHVRPGGEVPAGAGLVRLVDRAAGVPALPAALRGLLLQPRGGGEVGPRHQLQARGVPEGGGGLRRGARKARPG